MNYLIDRIVNASSPPHKHKNYEVVVYANGNGYIIINDKKIETYSGRIIIIPPETIHSAVMTDENFERIYINGKFNHIFNITQPIFINDNASKDGLLLAKMIYNNRYSNHEYLSSLINAFEHFVLQNIKMDDYIFLAIKEIIETISNEYHNSDINLNYILNKSGYAEDYIRSQFKKITGKTPTEFLTKIRISQACYLIDTYKSSLSLSDISEKCGYTDYIYFSRRFKHIMGVSPKEYMNNN